MKNFFKHLLLEEAGNEGGAGGAGTTDGTGEQKQEMDYKSLYEESLKRIEAVDGKNKELLSKLKITKEKVDAIEAQKASEIMKKAEETGDLAKILEITKEELNTIKSQLADKEEKELSRKESLLKEAKTAEFIKALGDVDFFDREDALKSVNWDKFALESDENGNPIGFNKEGIKQAVEDFRTKYFYKIKSKDVQVPSNAAKGGKVDKQSEAQKTLKSFVLGE